MKKSKRPFRFILWILSAIVIFGLGYNAGRASVSTAQQADPPQSPAAGSMDKPQTPADPSDSANPGETKPGSDDDGKNPKESKPEAKPESNGNKSDSSTGKPAIHVVAHPDQTDVLVNKWYKLPQGYKPSDLVEPDVPYIFKEKAEKRLMREPAARALEQLFDGAAKDGIQLAGVSAYRSEKTQKTLFQRYVNKDGLEAARRYSAEPGHSEHQTGLSIDVSGRTGKCAATDCFAGTDEADWLDKHAHEYGFIIRYPEGKEAITGYKYEPWHIRFVGTDIAQDIVEQHLTLEEYMKDTLPVES